MRIGALKVMAPLVAHGLVLVGLVGCNKKAPQPFSCDRYQRRMERCESYVVAAVKRRFDADVKIGALDRDEADAKRKALQRRIRRRIRYKNSKRLCEKLQKLRTPHHRKRFTTMKYCYRRSGCEGFAQCILALW